MIKKVIHCSDLHIRNIARHEEYKIQLQKLIDECKNISSEYEFGEVVVLIAGDIFHQKIQSSNEQTDLFAWFIKELNKICFVRIICGNHDFLENNKDRMDTITPIIKLLELPNVKYLDMELGYKSGIYHDDNVAWCLYSIFDEYKKPDIEIEKINHPDKKFIGLFHGALSGSITDTSYQFTGGHSLDIFSGSDVIMCGDIHKRQELVGPNGIKVVYPGSYCQQDVGESVSRHGFLLWDVDTLEYEEFDIPSEYGFYKFSINSIEDIENATESFVNF